MVKLAEPVVVVPSDSTSATNSSALVCDLGTVQVRSVTHRKDEKVNYKELSDVSKLYDYYELTLKSIQAYIAEDTGAIEPIALGTKEQQARSPDKFPPQHKYIRDLSLQVRLYNCLEPLHPSLPVMKIGGILNRVDIVLTDYNAVYVLRILDNVLKEQMGLSQRLAATKKAAADKLIAEHGGVVEAAKAVSDIVSITKKENSPKNSAAAETKKETSTMVLGPDKKVREVMVHFDDINVIFGKTLIKGRGAYIPGYTEELREKNRGEVPFVADMRAGINGVGLHAYMTFGGGVTVKSHVFRVYVKDLQLRPRRGAAVKLGAAATLEEKYGLEKVVARDFEDIVHSPDVDALKDRLVGDNYAPFPSNAKFFERVEAGSYLEEQKNQIDISLEGNLTTKNLKLSLDLNDMSINLPYDSLAPSLYDLSEILAALPTPPEAVPQEKRLSLVLAQQAHKAIVAYTFGFQSHLKGIDVRLPINVLLVLTRRDSARPATPSIIR